MNDDLLHHLTKSKILGVLLPSDEKGTVQKIVNIFVSLAQTSSGVLYVPKKAC